MDLFFYREPEETKQEEEGEAPAGQDYAIADFNAAPIGAVPADGQWTSTIDQPWPDTVPQPIPAVPGAGVSWAAPDAAGTA